MSVSDDIRYRQFLLRRAIQRPGFTVPTGLGGAVSLLLTLHNPIDIVFGLIPTATYFYVGMENTVLPFPPAIRGAFRRWFDTYYHLKGQVPADSGIALEGASVDPEFILGQLQQMKAQGAKPSHYEVFQKEMDAAFADTARSIEEVRQTQDRIRVKQISSAIREQTERLRSSAANYKTALNEVYSPEESAGDEKPNRGKHG